ncbi:MAG: O-antigen ligase family protein [Nitrospira sp.]|nr:O-antigen ligase family protein [Nitrospira sp.]
MTDADDMFLDETHPRSWVGIVLGVWLAGVFAASLFGRLDAGREAITSMVWIGAAVTWPLAYFMVARCRFVPDAMSMLGTVAVVLFGIFSILSSFFSPVALLSSGYVVLTLLGLWLALQFNSNLDAEQYEQGLKLFAVLTTGLLVAFAWYDYVPGTRLGTGKNILNPNTIALVSTSVFMAAMAIRTLAIRLVVMGLITTVIVLTGSRAAAIAVVLGLAATGWLRLRSHGRPVLLLFGLGCLFIAGTVLMYGGQVYDTLDRLYSLSTADRGIGSGASGRLEAWKSTWELFLRNPFIGVGFRAHEFLLRVDSSSHNGYLATLAEVGLIGFLAIACLIARGLQILWVRAQRPEGGFVPSLLLGLSVGYLFLAVFERFLLNVGNPTSLLFLLAVMQPQWDTDPLPEEDELAFPVIEDSTVG